MAEATWLRSAILAFLLAGLVAAGLHLGFGDLNLNLADEGYLWYGVLGVQGGEVPFRDFQAYDPGRYYWCAFWSKLFGSGILGVRASLALFQALGLFAGLLVVRRFLKHDLWLLPMALILGLWMFPRHKLFEPSLALFVLWSCVRLLENPSLGRHLVSGLCVGLVAWFGRNHGFYAGLGMGAAYAYLLWKRPSSRWASRLGALALGVVLGYLPMLISLAFVPGFAAAYWSELTNLANKGANLPLAYAWPWSAHWGAAEHSMELLGQWSTNLAFSLPLLILPPALWRMLRVPQEPEASPEGAGFAPERAALLGSTIIGLIYLHHVAVRSDAQHLAQCIEPLLLAGLALASGARAQRVGVSVLSCLSFFFVFQNHSILRFFAPWRPDYVTVEQVIGDETLRLNVAQASFIKALLGNVGGRMRAADQVFIAPSRATLYPLLGKRSPVRELYMVWPATDKAQQAMITSLDEQRVSWALVFDTEVDDRADLRFENTHPLVWAHLLANYRDVPAGLGKGSRLLRRKPGGQ